MAITIVSSVISAAASGANITLPITGGAGNDVVVVFGGFAGGTATAPGVISPSGYTSVYVLDDANNDFKIQWKRLGSTPDPSVLLAGSGDAADAGAYGLYVLRGVDTSANPFDATIKTSVAAGVPQSPSIITATNNAMVLALAGNDVNDASLGTVTNFDANIGAGVNDTDDFSAGGAASIIGTAGTISPTAWSTWTSGNYVSATLALKETTSIPNSIAFDTAVAGGYTLSGTSHTFSHTCTGDELILFVLAFVQIGTTTGVTYNGTAMTLVDSQGHTGGNVSMWYLLNPAVGAHNVVVTASGTTVVAGKSASYTGVRQSAQPDASFKQNFSGTSSVWGAVTTVADNCWTILMVSDQTGGELAGTGTTLRVAADGQAIFDSNGAISPAGTNFLRTSNAVLNWGVVMASFAPSGNVVSSGAKLLQLLGVGT